MYICIKREQTDNFFNVVEGTLIGVFDSEQDFLLKMSTGFTDYHRKDFDIHPVELTDDDIRNGMVYKYGGNQVKCLYELYQVHRNSIMDIHLKLNEGDFCSARNWFRKVVA